MNQCCDSERFSITYSNCNKFNLDYLKPHVDFEIKTNKLFNLFNDNIQTLCSMQKYTFETIVKFMEFCTNTQHPYKLYFFSEDGSNFIDLHRDCCTGDITIYLTKYIR